MGTIRSTSVAVPFGKHAHGRATSFSRILVSCASLLLFCHLTLAEEQGEKKTSPPAPQSASPLFYEESVAKILAKHCFDCHDTESREGRLDLTSIEGLLKGSDSGPVITPRNAAHSLLYEVVSGGEMPPEGPALEKSEVQMIEKWISGGAHFRHPPQVVAAPPSQHEILPILLLRCATCHGAELQRGDLDLRSVASLKKGGQHGPVAIAGDPDGSVMIQRVEQELCPPKGQLLKYFVERASSTEIEKMREWIQAGFPEVPLPEDVVSGLPDPHITDEDREHWAFRPLPQSIPVPQISGRASPQPIDAFIAERLAAAGLEFSPPATRDQLIRRVYLDVIGLPPTVQELQHWEERPGNWYEEMVETLLASPHYGERWGRYWLDVAGYADSEGGVANDPVREFAWKYRDYVIRSFNADKPWDRFLLEQIAGDELAEFRDPKKVTDAVVDNLIATGFLRMTVDQTGSRTMNFVPERIGLISDVINVVSSGVMGLTMGCARCHSHKYDPIPQSDYYRFKAIFQGAYDEHDWMSWKTRTLTVATPAAIAERKAVNAPLEKKIKELAVEEKALVKAEQDRIYQKAWPQLDQAEQQAFQSALKSRKRPSPSEKLLLEKYDREIRPTRDALVKQSPELAAALKRISQETVRLREQLIPEQTIRALWDRGRPSPSYLLVRGEYQRAGRPVGPGVPSVLVEKDRAFEIEQPWPGAESTGRRLALARWLVEPNHPLTARVLVNRVWSRHFGRGIVKTVDNFGALGAAPTHPELLDWLSRDFINHGWHLKSLHRRILLSRTYQQSSGVRPDEVEQSPAESSAMAEAARRRQTLDPENELLSRMPLLRLNAEALRDSLLSVADARDDQLFGPPAAVTARADGLITETPSASGRFRRSIYLQMRRTEIPTLLSSFDYPEMQPNCTERAISTVSTQSLVMLNNAGIHDLAARFAKKSFDDCRHDPANIVETIYRAAYSRAPTQEERSEGDRTLSQLEQLWKEHGSDPQQAFLKALTTYCHTVLNSAEFAYID